MENTASIEMMVNTDKTSVSIHITSKDPLTLDSLADILKQYAEGIKAYKGESTDEN